MIDQLLAMLVGFVISYLGSIPPGTLNITSMQYGITGAKRPALVFAGACAFVEFFYAGLAVEMQILISENPIVQQVFEIVAIGILLIMGMLNLVKKAPQTSSAANANTRGALAKGMILSILNPLAIPFWLAITIVLRSGNWLTFDRLTVVPFVFGISLGTFFLLYHVSLLAARFGALQRNTIIVYKLPGLVLIGMAIYTALSTSGILA